MSTKGWNRFRGISLLAAVPLCVAASTLLVPQGPAPTREPVADAVGFKEFSDRVQAYLKLQKTVESGLPAMKSTDLPELITANQQVLARKIREARPDAKAGDLFTPAACEAFRHTSSTMLAPNTTNSLAYMQQGAPDPAMPLAVNGIYPDTEPNTGPSPVLLAAFPPLPDGMAYRVVGRALVVIDVKSRLIVDVARLILPSGLP